MVSAGLFPDQPKLGPGAPAEPADRKVAWLWNSKWRTVEERGFIEVDVPSFQMDRVLVAAGIVDSRSNAQRLIKQNSISWRRDDGADWAKVADFRQELEPGWPVILRVGDGHWRSLLVEVEVTENPPMGATDKTPIVKKVSKPRQFPGLAMVMRPTEDQTIDLWTELWK